MSRAAHRDPGPRSAAPAAGALAERTEALAEAVAAAEGRLPDEVVAPAREVLARALERSRLSAEHTVVALAGATGAGKSSVFNALVGSEVARTSQQRPTTAHPLAVVVESPQLAATGGSELLLDWLGVPERRDHPVDDEHPSGLVLLDLPDHDSIVAEHRRRADHVTERADLLVWVTNPQKYADAVLHARYLAPLAERDLRVLVVLNQADRLSEREVADCLADLERLVRADGLDPHVLATSAVTGQGMAELQEAVADAVRRRRAATQRLTGEVRAAARSLLDALGPRGGDAPAVRGARTALVDALEQAAGVPLVVSAVEGASLRDAIARTGWPPTRWLQRFRADPLRTLGLRREAPRLGRGSARTSTGSTGDAADADVVPRRSSLPAASPAVQARLASAARGYVAAASAELPGAWGEELNARVVEGVREIADPLDVAVARSVRVPPARWWGVVGFWQWLLLAVLLAGLAWLALLAGIDYLRLPSLDVPVVTIGRLRWPWPSLLAIGGALIGILLAAVSRAAARVSARRRARTVRAELRRSVEALAGDRLIGRVDDELAALARVRAAATRAAD
ncbi:MAG: 50S ribosome-binding GTPase [Salana multivorans]|nr:50S ribosome-binding GTPase [Salana multivorans]